MMTNRLLLSTLSADMCDVDDGDGTELDGCGDDSGVPSPIGY